MPQTRIQKANTKNKVVRVKFKIGGRASMKGAKQMSNKELLEAVQNVKRKKDYSKLIQVVDQRNLKVA